MININKLDRLLARARDKVSVIGWPYITDGEFIVALGLKPDDYKKVLPDGEVVYNIQKAGTDVTKSLDWNDEEE